MFESANTDEQIHLWTVHVSDLGATDLIARCRNVLSQDELLRSSRFVFEKDRVLYILGHALVRVMLSAFCDVKPSDWKFTTNRFGKPFLCDGLPKLHFNLTHTQGLVACVVTSLHNVGVDAEFVNRKTDLDITKELFSKPELEQFERTTVDDAHDAFFDIWTLKEAYLKAKGCGLIMPLNSFSVIRKADQDPFLLVDGESTLETRSWRFFQFRPSPHYRLAVCVQYQQRQLLRPSIRQLSQNELFAV